MSLASEITTTKNLSELEDLVESEQFVQLTKYKRTHVGGYVEVHRYVAAYNGKADSEVWVNKYLSKDKEELYVKALKNLYRKLDFIELSQSLETEDISEEEFDKELTEHEDDYLIPSPSGTPTVQQIIQIANIVKQIGREKKISVDEVSEIFSLEMDKAMEVLNK